MRWIYKTSFLAAICAGLCLAACMERESEDRGGQVIEIAKAISAPAGLKASDYFDDVRYVALETSDNCLIGSSPNIRVLDRYILVTSAQKQCFLFDKETGKFKCQVGHVGNDPGGYRNVDCQVDEPNGRLLFNGWGHDLIAYDLDGNYMGKIAIPSAGESYPSNNFAMGQDTIVGYFENSLGKERNRILFFKEGGERLALLPNMAECPPFEINSMSVWKGESAVEEFGPSALRSVVYMEGADPETASVMYPYSPNFWRRGKDTYFMETFNDTIFRLDGTALRPYLWFSRGEMEWDYKDRFRKDKSKGIFIPEVLDGKHVLFALAITDLYDQERRKTYNVAFDKRSGRVEASLSGKGIEDDITGFLPIHLLSVSSSGEYGGLFLAADVTEWFDTLGDKECPKALAGLKDLEEEQNPVVILLK